MAITEFDYRMFLLLKDRRLLPANPDVLELGESSWYGDFHIQIFADEIQRRVPDIMRRQRLLARLQQIIIQQEKRYLFDIAKIFYEALVAPKTLDAIDLDPVSSGMKKDLNEPHALRHYDIVVDLGTAEHIFNIAQFFRSVHEWTKPGGLMLHSTPMQGWFDHGFYNVQPTLYYDLAAANGYEVLLMAVGRVEPMEMVEITSREHLLTHVKDGTLPSNALLWVALRQAAKPEAFKIPMQGYYDNAISDEARKAWHAMRC